MFSTISFFLFYDLLGEFEHNTPALTLGFGGVLKRNEQTGIGSVGYRVKTAFYEFNSSFVHFVSVRALILALELNFGLDLPQK